MKILIIVMIGLAVYAAVFALFSANRGLGKAFDEIDRRRRDNER